MKKTPKNKWEKFYKAEGYSGRYPNEDVVRFMQKYFPESLNRAKIKVLDWGVGTGRHAVYLAKEGFKVFGAEVSASGIDLTKKWLKREKLKARLNKIDGLKTPYQNNFFDAIIDCAVLQHNRKNEMKKMIAEMRRILKPGGRIFSLVKAQKDSLFEHGRHLLP